MTINFRKPKATPQATEPNQPAPLRQLWIPPASKLEAEERLFSFLRSLRDGRAQAQAPLLVEAATLRQIYAAPHPDLVTALRHCVDQFLVELGADPAIWGEVSVSPAVLGLVLAAYDCLAPLPPTPEPAADPVVPFLTALIQTLPPARALPEMLVYHAVLNSTAENLPFISAARRPIMHALLDRSPFSAIYHLHLHTPPPLTALAAELLHWWRSRAAKPAPWRSLDDWLGAVVPLLSHPAIATWLRRRWLALPETRELCRNLGLLLEALRRRGDMRGFVLEFYEAYDRFRAEELEDSWRGRVRGWPLLDQIERLLRAEGDSEAAIALNRRGNEYFLLFRPLLQIIIDEGGGVPNDYNLLKLDFVLALRSLLELTTEQTGQGLELGGVAFTSEDQR